MKNNRNTHHSRRLLSILLALLMVLTLIPATVFSVSAKSSVTIDSVDLSVTAPTENAEVGDSKVSTSSDAYVITKQKWYLVADDGSDTIIYGVSDSETFAPGYYMVIISLETDFGYKFSKDIQKPTFDGATKMETDISDNSEIMTVCAWYTVGLPSFETVDSVSAVVPLPSEVAGDDGDLYYYSGDVEIPENVGYRVTDMNYYVYVQNQYDSSSWYAYANYNDGSHYAVLIEFETRADYRFSDDVFGKLNDNNAEVTISEDNTIATLWYRYDSDPLTIDHIGLNCIDGQLDGETISGVSDFTDNFEPDLYKPHHFGGFILTDAQWQVSDSYNGEYAPITDPDSVFDITKYYRVVATLSAQEGYSFTSDVIATIESDEEGTAVTSDDGKTLTATFDISVTNAFAKTGDKFKIPTPVAGETLSTPYHWCQKGNGNYRFFADWYEVPYVGSTQQIKELTYNEDTFEEGKTYYLIAELWPKNSDKWAFPDDYDAEIRTIDDSEPSPTALVEKNGSHEWHIWYTVGDVPDPVKTNVINITGPGAMELTEESEFSLNAEISYIDVYKDDSFGGMLSLDLTPKSNNYFAVGNDFQVTYNGLTMSNAVYSKTKDSCDIYITLLSINSEAENGTVNAFDADGKQATFAMPGETITFSLTPNDGYHYVKDSLKVSYYDYYSNSDVEIPVVNNTITIPQNFASAVLFGNYITCTVKFAPDNEIDRVDVINVKLDYKDGEMPAATAEKGDEFAEHYRVTEVWEEVDLEREEAGEDPVAAAWYSGPDFEWTGDAITTFEEGKSYRYQLFVAPEDGYTFADDIPITINGVSIDEMTTNISKDPVYGALVVLPPFTVVKETEPTEPTSSEIPTETEPTQPTSSEIPTETEPTQPTSSDMPTKPTETEPTTPSTTDPDVPDKLLGDVNNDGIVNIDDVTYLQMHLAGYKTSDGSPLINTDDIVDFEIADYDKNSVIDINDATSIQRYLAGL